jgi:hypothetical protein
VSSWFNILILVQFLLSTHFLTIIRYRFLPMLSFMLPSKHKNQRGSLLLWSELPRVSVTPAKFPCTQVSQLNYIQQIALLKVSVFQLFDRSKISSFLTVKFQLYCKCNSNFLKQLLSDYGCNELEHIVLWLLTIIPKRLIGFGCSFPFLYTLWPQIHKSLQIFVCLKLHERNKARDALVVLPRCSLFVRPRE